jgi:hypothetical protein
VACERLGVCRPLQLIHRWIVDDFIAETLLDLETNLSQRFLNVCGCRRTADR